MSDHTRLGSFLNQIQRTYHHASYLNSDPLEFVHRYTDPWDREAVALFAALLAYGRVTQIRQSVSEVLRRMEEVAGTPSAFVRGFPANRHQSGWRNAFANWTHRFNQGGDLELLTLLLAETWELDGSLGARFVAHLSPDDKNIGAALEALIADWKLRAEKLKPSLPVGSFNYLLTSPKDGSCCKRWCMFLRWMGRRDSIDPGLWATGGSLQHTFPRGRFLAAHQLIMPLDTHTGRISGYLGLTNRRTLDWKAALEITQALSQCDLPGSALDPVKYDFALARLGILEICTRSFRPEICGKCPLEPACLFAHPKQKPGRVLGRSAQPWKKETVLAPATPVV